MLSKSHTDILKSCHTLLYSDTSHAVSVYKTTIFFYRFKCCITFGHCKGTTVFLMCKFFCKFF
nr:MAG TPA: hypothetical protein [Caudoviricetes sp.]